MLFSISAIHSLAILATADHEPTCVEIGFTILCNSDIILSASFLVEQKFFKESDVLMKNSSRYSKGE